MQIFRGTWFRIRSLVQRAKINAEFDDELRDHIARETAFNIARGLSADESRRQALAAFGGVERFKEALRDERHTRWLDDITGDFKHGARLLRKNALFSAAVIGTLALAIGATTTIFTLINGVLLRPLPYAHAERLVAISQTSSGKRFNSVDRVTYNAIVESNRTLSSVAAFNATSAAIVGAGTPLYAAGGLTTASFFSVLGTGAALGRVYQSEEESVGAQHVVVLSDAIWRVRFGGDSTVLGKTLTLDDVPHIVIGVMPPQFDLPRGSQYWIPMPKPVAGVRVRPYVQSIGVLRTGVTATAAQRELASILMRTAPLRNKSDRENGLELLELHEQLFGSATKPLAFLFGAVAVLLLIACANVANLTLARSVARKREFAVRLALGASRGRLVRQLVIESALLAIVGGVIGVGAPVLLVGKFARLSPTTVASVSNMHIDATVLTFAAITTVLTTILFGLVPALTVAYADGRSSLAAGGSRSGISRAVSSFRAALVVFQVAAALTLSTGAGLLARSFANALSVDPGFNASGVYSAVVALPKSRYGDVANVQEFYRELLQQTRALNGVQSATLSDALPLSAYPYSTFLNDSEGGAGNVEVAVSAVDGEFGKTLGLKLVAGRFISKGDRIGDAPVAMITSTAANRLFPGVNAVGHSLGHVFQGNVGKPTVVGVVSDIAQDAVDVTPLPQVFLAAAQVNAWPVYMTARTSISAAEFQRILQRVVSTIDPTLPLTRFISLDSDLARSVAPRRFNSLLVNAFALLAVILATVGLYALMSNAVAARTRELGIRMALGAGREHVVRLVLRNGLALTAAGVTAGVALSFALARSLQSLLYRVTPHDATVFAAAPALLSLISIVACCIPARRATRVDPMHALRQE